MTSVPTLQVGAARYAITPPLGVSLAGSYADRRAAGFHDDLYARALVIDDGAAQIAIVSCDLIGINATTVANARRIVQERCGIPGDHVLIHATHNHSGPLTRDLTISGMYGEVDDGYLAQLERHIAAAVGAAFARRAPARLHLSLGECRGIAFNRRFHMRSGPVRTNAGKLNPEIVEPAAPVDERVWTLTALPPASAAASGSEAVPPSATPLALLVNFGLHTAIVAGTIVGADFPAYLELGVRRLLGADSPLDARAPIVVFANAPCGDINHVDVSHSQRQGSFAEAARVGTILAAAASQGACRMNPDWTAAPATGVRGKRAAVDLPLRLPTEEEVIWARQHIAGKMSMAPGGGLEVVEANRIVALADHYHGQSKTTEVQALAIGEDLAVVGLPGEVFAELGLDLRARSPFRHTLVLGITNEAIGYVPTRRAYAEGGYEPASSRYQPGSGEQLVDAALHLLATLKT